MPKQSNLTPPSKALHATGQKLTMNLFAFKKKDWGEEHKDHIKKIKPGDSTKGVDMAYYFHEIDGSEHPELFLLWLLEYRRNVLKADNITLTGKVDCLMQLVRGEAKSKVARSFESTDVRSALTAPERTPTTVVNCFTNISLKKKITSFTPTDLATYLATPGTEGSVDALTIDRIEEALHVLKIHVFGRDHAGRNALVKLQRQIRNLKVTVDGGIQKWASCMDDFQSYIPHMPWEAGELNDMSPAPFTEMEARVILDGALHHLYHQELVKLDWNLFAQPLEETISKLESAEPDILLRKELMA